MLISGFSLDCERLPAPLPIWRATVRSETWQVVARGQPLFASQATACTRSRSGRCMPASSSRGTSASRSSARRCCGWSSAWATCTRASSGASPSFPRSTRAGWPARLGRFDGRLRLGLLHGRGEHPRAARCRRARPGCARCCWNASASPTTSATSARWATTPASPWVWPSSCASRKTWLRVERLRLFGAPLMMDAVVPGGVASTSTPRAELLVGQCERIAREVDALRAIYDEHAGLQDRFITTGSVSDRLALQLGLTGLAARASGLPHDLRCDLPVAPYPAVGVTRAVDSDGDVAARVAVRFDEASESLRMMPRVAGRAARRRDPRAAATRCRAAFGIGLVEGWRGPCSSRWRPARAGPSAAATPRSLVAQLAGAGARGDRQHRSRFPADQQILQPVLQRRGPVRRRCSTS
jgi:hypothetical protein